jgi:putative ABC transport system permease protein
MAGEGREPPRPSRLLSLVLRRLLDARDRRTVQSEMEELWRVRFERYGAASADRWYRRQLRRYPLRLIGERLRALSVRQASLSRSVEESDAVWSGLGSDVRQSLRGWRRAPLLAVTIILTVGLGIGATTAMLAVVNRVLLSPLPYAGPDRLVRVYHALSGNRWPLSVVDFQAIAEQQTVFDDVAAYTTSTRTYSDGETVERVRIKAVTANYFDLLGIRPDVGRSFDAGESQPGGPKAVVVSHGFSARHLTRGESPVGSTIRLDGEAWTVVGVLGAGVGPLESRYDVFPALQLEPPRRRGPFFLTVIGRMHASKDTAIAATELRAINARIFPIWQAGYQDRTATWGLMPLAEFVSGRVRPLLWILLGTVGFVLVIATANASGLLLARASRQRREFAARAALGASRARLLRLMLTDSLLLAGAGACLGLLIAKVALAAVRTLGPDYLPRASEIDAGQSVALVVMILAAGSGLLFGLVPALQLLRGRDSLVGALREGGRSMTGSGSAQRTRRLIVAFEFAIAMPLLVGAGLLFNSFLKIQSVDPGVNMDHLLTGALALPDVRYSEPGVAHNFRNRLLDRIRALPGVEAAATNDSRPPRDFQGSNNFDLLDRPAPDGQAQPIALWVTTTPGYFETMGIPLLAGRAFDDRDQPEAAVVVDREWAEHFYPDGDALGKRFVNGGCTGADCQVSTVIGIVDNVVYTGLDADPAGGVHGTIYTPAGDAGFAYLFLRTRGDPMLALPGLRSTIHDMDPDLALYDVATGDELVDAALVTPRNLARIVAAFASTALLLALIGVYGIMAFFVQTHERDIGIRIALGGRPAGVRRAILTRGMQPALLGIMLGTALTLSLARFVADLLYAVPARDPLTFAVVALTLLGSATIACWLPAHRATTADPVRILRDG